MPFRAVYDKPKGLSKRQTNDLINQCEAQLKQAIPNFKTLGKVKFKTKFAIYYDDVTT